MGHNEDVVFAWGGGGICDVPHRIGGKVPGAIYVKVPLNLVDAFQSRESLFGSKADNIYTIGSGSLHILSTKFLSQIASFIASVATMYSSSIVDKAIIDCKVAF